MHLKPKNLLDVAHKSDVFAPLAKRVNLFGGSFLRVPIKRVFIVALVFASVFSLLFGFGLSPSRFAMAPTGNAIFAAENEEERKQLEAQLSELENQLKEQEAALDSYKRQGKTLKSEIDRLNANVSKLNLQIKAVSLTIAQLDKNISTTQTEIHGTETDIGETKAVISKLLQNLYENDDTPAIQILLQNPKLSDFFGNLNSIIVVQDNLRGELQKIITLRNDLLDKKEALALQRKDAQAIKNYQDSQRAAIQKNKTDKDSLLKVTKGQESKYQELVATTKKTAAEIRNRIFRLLGGGELPFGEAVKIAKVAERALGVRAALILAVLTQESAINGVIGGNLGRCYYNTPWKNGSGTVMSNTQKPYYLATLAELGSTFDPNTTPVSCPISSDGDYGGAMGPAQFMPKTWSGYKDRVGQVTGGKPASPFNNLDAFTATALYLSDGLEGCRAIYSKIFDQESCAAAKYYAGGNWRSYTRVGRYGYRVAERAADFENDIEVLDSQ